MRKKIIAGLGAGLALAVVGSGAALALSTYTGDDLNFGPDSTMYGLGYDAWYLQDSSALDAWDLAHPTADAYNDNSWDDRGVFGVDDGTDNYSRYTNDSGDGFRDCVQDLNGSDTTIVCDDEVINGLTVHPEVYFYSDVNLARVVYVMSNDSDSAVDTTVRVRNYSECDGNGFVLASNGESGMSDTGLATDEWNWTVQREEDSTSGECAVEATAWQSAGANVVASTNDEDGDFDSQSIFFPVALAPGDTIGLAVFYGDAWIDDNNESFVEGDPTNGYIIGRQAAFQSQVDYFTENVSDWNATTSRGVSPDLNVVNWASSAAAPAPEPELAKTGVNAVGIAGLLAVLSAVGFAMLATRRRAASK